MQRITGLFRQTVKALTQRAAPTPKKSRRKRSGEEEARSALRFLRIIHQRQQQARASIFMSEMLDWLHIWHHHDSPATSGQSTDNSFTAGPNHLSPNL